MNTLSIDQLLRAAQLFDQRNMLQLVARGSDLEEISKLSFPTYTALTANNNNNNVNGYCNAYSSGNSSTSSLRSSPTSSMLSSGPASPLQIHASSTSTGNQASLAVIKKKSSSSSKQSRAAHNELEKNRRANLRSYLDQIKDILPPEYDSSRDTTLSLLTRARNHIKQWRHRREVLTLRKTELKSKNAELREKIEAAKAVRNSKRCRQVEQAQKKPVVPVPAPVVEPVVEHPKPVLTQPAVVVTPVASPIFMDFTPSKTFTTSLFSTSGMSRMVTIDPYLEGLLPAVPLSYPYPYVQQSLNRSTIV